MAASDSQTFLRELDKKLWTAADKLRSNLDAAVCKHAVLGLIFLKYVSDSIAQRQAEIAATTGEVVNVGVVVNCLQPCFLHFEVERRMPDRIKAFFPDYAPGVFEAAATAMEVEVKRISARIRDPKGCQFAFNELVRPRDNTLRFGEVRTAVTAEPLNLSEELFRRYVKMEEIMPQAVANRA